MPRIRPLVGYVAFVALTLAPPAFAQQPPETAGGPATPADAPAAPNSPGGQAGPRQPTIEELQRQLEVLAEEVEKLRSGEEGETPLTPEQRRALGLSPSAAAAYERKQGVSFAGYGEVLFENYADENQRGDDVSRASQFDMLRAVVYTGYRFTDKFVFNSEIEFEHGGDEISIEFAYLDYLVNDNLTIRAGNVLVPMGLVNEFHEPTVFIGAKRPETERRILPSTWHENGGGILGSKGRFAYRAYVLNGLNAAGFSADGLRGGRQGGALAKASDFGVVGRLDFTPTAGVFVGGSVYTGGADQGEITLDRQDVSVTTTIGEVHAQAQMRGFDVRGVFAVAGVDGAGDLNRARNLTGTAAVAESMHGGYLQAGYNLLSQRSSVRSLTPYYRFEAINTHAGMPDGYAADPARDGQFHSLGIELRPIYAIVLKTEYQWIRNDARTGRNQFNVNVGYAF